MMMPAYSGVCAAHYCTKISAFSSFARSTQLELGLYITQEVRRCHVLHFHATKNAYIIKLTL